MNSPENKQKLFNKCADLTIKLHKHLKECGCETPKEADEIVEKLIIQRVSECPNCGANEKESIDCIQCKSGGHPIG